jgi:hypothetical protein
MILVLHPMAPVYQLTPPVSMHKQSNQAALSANQNLWLVSPPASAHNTCEISAVLAAARVQFGCGDGNKSE